MSGDVRIEMTSLGAHGGRWVPLLVLWMAIPACGVTAPNPSRPRSVASRARTAPETERRLSCATALVLKTDESALRLELWQHGKRIPLCDDAWHLAAAPFVFRLRGHLHLASYRLTSHRKETRILETLVRPLVSSGGHGLAITGMELQHRYRLVETHLASARWFETQWVGDRYGKSPRGADDYAHWLKRRVGEQPLYADFGRVYFPSQPKSQFKNYHLNKFIKLPERRGVQGEFPVRQIQVKPVSGYRYLRMTVFLEKHLGRASLIRLQWRFVDLHFHPCKGVLH